MPNGLYKTNDDKKSVIYSNAAGQSISSVVCKIEGCYETKLTSRFRSGLCNKHYLRIKIHNDPHKVHKNLTFEQKKANKQKYDVSDAGRFSALKSKAKERNIECSISLEQFSDITSNECYYCFGNFQTKNSYGGYFIDRKDNKLGYVSNNCIPCCFVCNSIKSDKFSTEETECAVEAILAYRGLI